MLPILTDSVPVEIALHAAAINASSGTSGTSMREGPFARPTITDDRIAECVVQQALGATKRWDEFLVAEMHKAVQRLPERPQPGNCAGVKWDVADSQVAMLLMMQNLPYLVGLVKHLLSFYGYRRDKTRMVLDPTTA